MALMLRAIWFARNELATKVSLGESAANMPSFLPDSAIDNRHFTVFKDADVDLGNLCTELKKTSFYNDHRVFWSVPNRFSYFSCDSNNAMKRVTWQWDVDDCTIPDDVRTGLSVRCFVFFSFIVFLTAGLEAFSRSDRHHLQDRAKATLKVIHDAARLGVISTVSTGSSKNREFNGDRCPQCLLEATRTALYNADTAGMYVCCRSVVYRCSVSSQVLALFSMRIATRLQIRHQIQVLLLDVQDAWH